MHMSFLSALQQTRSEQQKHRIRRIIGVVANVFLRHFAGQVCKCPAQHTECHGSCLPVFFYAMLGPKDQAWSLGAWSVGFLSIFLQGNDPANVDASPLSKCLSWMGSCWDNDAGTTKQSSNPANGNLWVQAGLPSTKKNSGRNASHTQTTNIWSNLSKGRSVNWTLKRHESVLKHEKN